MTRSVAIQWLAAWGLCLVAFGCSETSQDVPVRGRVTNAGAPLEVAGRDVGLGWVEVQFYRIGDDGQVASEPETAHADEQGRFEILGPHGRGLPKGRYRIGIRQWDPYDTVDRLQGRFSREQSKIVREAAGQEILIDVSRPEG